MLGWRKRSEGSDIRGTFEQRREQLRRRVLGARRAVGTRIHRAGTVTVAGLRAAGAAVRVGARATRRAATVGGRRLLSVAAPAAAVARLRSAGAAVRTGARATGRAVTSGGRRVLRGVRTAPVAVVAGVRATGAAALGGARATGRAASVGAQRLRSGLAATGTIAGRKARAATGALTDAFAHVSNPALLTAGGALALGAGIGRYRGAGGIDGEALALLALGGALAATALLPLAIRSAGFSGIPPLAGTAAVAVAVLAAAAAWPAVRGKINLAGLGGGKEVMGRASVVAGDLLKVGGTTVRLAGIEAPERTQICGKDASRWRCAEAAQSALAKAVTGRSVRCRLGGIDRGGNPLGYCSLDSVDINADLVRQGYVFADGGMSGRYGADEQGARTAKAGMWVADAARPAELRAKAWEQAKRRAPDGCPIKGQVTGAERVYVLPGTPAYERLRVQASRGDRWFCSEQDAASAGFKAAQRG